MHLKLALTIFAVVMTITSAAVVQRRQKERGQGRRGGPERRRPHPPPPEGDRFTWTRELGEEESVEEGAFAPTNTSLIMENSFDPALREDNMTAASTLYDFSAEKAVVAIRPRGRGRRAPCFLTETTLTYVSAIDALNQRNGSTATTSQTIDLDGTSEPLSREEAEALFETNPSLRRACRGTVLVAAVPAGSNPTPSEDPTRTLTLLTLDAEVTITVPEPEERPSGGPRRGPHGGPRGGSRGGPRGGSRGGHPGGPRS